jgi:predicted ATPase/class 3 adenylate cyclase
VDSPEAELNCKKCGFENPDKSKFCGGCGCAIPLPVPLTNYLPSRISEKILAARAQMEGERKVISVLFADIVNYSSLADKLDVEVLQEIINSFFKTLIELVSSYEGVVAQLLGDGMMVFFGAPLAREDHAQGACYSALAMQAATCECAERLRQQHGIDFKIRIGINSGPVFVGAIGNDLHMEYLAIGNTVNLASRMQNAALPGKILVSANTHHLTRHYFDFGPKRVVVLKGSEQSAEARELLNARKIESRFDAAVLEGLSRFCGRENEMRELYKVFTEVERGNGRIVGVMGEPGIGKSRLLKEFRESLTPGEGTFYEGRCIHYGKSLSYMPLKDLLKTFFKIEESDSEPQLKEKILLKAGRLDEHLVSDMPFIYELLSLNIEDKTYYNIEPECRRNKMFSTIARLLARESSRQPVIILIEDLQWIDGTSEELIAYLIQKLENSPILFLLSYRPEYSPSWKNQAGYRQIHLNPLSSDSTSALLKSLLPHGELAPDLTSIITAKAGGNPLFLEEYTYALLERDKIQNDGGVYSIPGSPDSIKLPDTLRGIIASRIDQLPQDFKNTLQVAAVIGREFGYDLLRSVLKAPQKLRTQLESLENLEFIVEGSVYSETEYTFKHALIQQVAYDSLSHKRQRELHENTASHIEKIYSDRLEEFLDILAYHYRNGQSAEKALDYCIRAGDKARASFANRVAIDYFKQAVDLCSTLGDQADGVAASLHEKLQDIYMLTSYYDEARESCEAGYRLSEKFAESANSRESAGLPVLLTKHLPAPAAKEERMAALYFARSEICGFKRQTDEGLIWADKGLALSEISDQAKARLFYARAVIFLQRGEYKPALDCCEKAMEHAHKTGDEIEATSYCAMGYIFHQSGDDKIAADCYQRALDISVRLRKPGAEAEALDSLGICFSISGDWKSAEEYFRKSLSMSEKIGSEFLQARTLTNYSDILIRRGHSEELEEAIACNIKALGMRGRNAQGANWCIYANLAWASAKLGKMRQAREYCDQSLTELKQGLSKFWRWQGYLIAGDIYFSLGEAETALDYCRKSLDIVSEVKSTLGQGQVKLLFGRIYCQLGRWHEAEQELKESLNHLENSVSPPDEKAQALWNLALVYHEMNEAKYRDIPRRTIREFAQRATEIWARLGIAHDETLVSKIMGADV